jgi:hypothetical protein
MPKNATKKETSPIRIFICLPQSQFSPSAKRSHANWPYKNGHKMFGRQRLFPPQTSTSFGHCLVSETWQVRPPL